ncbi:MAG TPA: hypothetical protein VFZ53_09910 [Polyangiaceae bacterium]
MNKTTKLWFSAVGLALAAACGAPGSEDTDIVEVESALAGSLARGPIPSGLPARVAIGLFEGPGETWMRSSGVAWDVRYQYFTKGWANNWGWGARDGSWGLSYMRECDAARAIPTVVYYQMHGEPGGGEAQFLAKVQNAATMASYFTDVKLLMQRAKEFAKPVVVLFEPDGTGLLQQQAASNPSTYAAIEDSGMAELRNLPNTVAGLGLAFLELRKSVGANNVVLGIHVSAWASGKDIAYFNVTDALQPEVDKVYAFLAPFGLASNVTGATFDVLVGDPLDRDADYYRLVQNQDRFWNASDSASISSKSFNRYAEWVRLWNVKASKRWVLWQIPLGNSAMRNVANDGAPSGGYKDNRTEYFFANGTAHITKFADVGVIALLFGAGASGQSSYQNDQWTDGQLFMKTKAGAIINAGGVPLATGGSGGTGGTSGTGGTATGGTATGGTATGGTATGGTGGSAGGGDTARYNFESGVQGWTSSGGMITGVSSSTTRAFAGARSLAVAFNGPAGSQFARVGAPGVPAGRTVTYRVWFPSGSRITAIQPYVLQGAAGGWAWTGTWRATSGLSSNAWNTITVGVPAGAQALHELGVNFVTDGTWTGTAYVDAVTW